MYPIINTVNTLQILLGIRVISGAFGLEGASRFSALFIGVVIILPTLFFYQAIKAWLNSVLSKTDLPEQAKRLNVWLRLTQWGGAALIAVGMLATYGIGQFLQSPEAGALLQQYKNPLGIADTEQITTFIRQDMGIFLPVFLGMLLVALVLHFWCYKNLADWVYAHAEQPSRLAERTPMVMAWLWFFIIMSVFQGVSSLIGGFASLPAILLVLVSMANTVYLVIFCRQLQAIAQQEKENQVTEA